MPIADQKKIQSFIQYLINEITNIENVDIALQLAKTKWIAHNPDETVPGSNLTTQNVNDANAFINAINTLLNDHSAIIATLKSKDFPSHGVKSLD